MLFEIVHKKLAAVGGEDSLQVGTAILYVPQSVSKLPLEVIFLARPGTGIVFKHVKENFRAHCLKKHILGFKVSIEGASSHVGTIYYILNCYVVVTLCFKKRAKRLEYCPSGFKLSSVHNSSRTNLDKCSVSYIYLYLIVDFSKNYYIIFIEQHVRYRIKYT